MWRSFFTGHRLCCNARPDLDLTPIRLLSACDPYPLVLNRPLRTRMVGGVGVVWGLGAKHLWLPDWASLPQCDHEFFWGNLGLAEKTSERSDLDLAVRGHDTALGVAFHHDVAATLPHLLKPETLECALNFSPGDVRQLRHVPAQAP